MDIDFEVGNKMVGVNPEVGFIYISSRVGGIRKDTTT